jgi:hypothetical protein
MFHQQIYDLSRQVHAEYNAQFEGLYVPLQDEKPGLIRRLLASLRGSRDERTPHHAGRGNVQMNKAGAVAK